MSKTPAAFAVIVLLGLVWTPSARAQRTEAGLLAAWEEAQRADPGTVKFEKVKDRQYHFATKRFPFDGDIFVRNLVIEDYSAVNQNGMSMGTVEVELQAATDDFYRTYARSYQQWNVSNTLYWDPQSSRWLTSEKYFRQVRSRIPTQALWPLLTGFSWLGILLVILAGFIFIPWRYNAKIKVINQRSERTLQISERNGQLAERNSQLAERSAQLHEQTMKLSEQNAKVFGEILEEVKKLNSRP